MKNIASRPVAGTAGYLLPGSLVDFFKVQVDREFFAAGRAAEGNCFSTDAELNFFTADLALHEKTSIKHSPQRAQRITLNLGEIVRVDLSCEFRIPQSTFRN